VAIRAVIFDIGGVLEFTPRLGIESKWEDRLGLGAGDMNRRVAHIWRAGSIGEIDLEEVHTQLASGLDLTEAHVMELMDDVWKEYLGTLNTELYTYFGGLHRRFRTGILSNSFVGAREREQQAYNFESICDDIVYSHEVGIRKPDPRIYRLTCDRLAVRPEEAIFLDDVDENIAAACVEGLHGIVFRDNAQAISDIEAAILRQT